MVGTIFWISYAGYRMLGSVFWVPYHSEKSSQLKTIFKSFLEDIFRWRLVLMKDSKSEKANDQRVAYYFSQDINCCLKIYLYCLTNILPQNVLNVPRTPRPKYR